MIKASGVNKPNKTLASFVHDIMIKFLSGGELFSQTSQRFWSNDQMTYNLTTVSLFNVPWFFMCVSVMISLGLTLLDVAAHSASQSLPVSQYRFQYGLHKHTYGLSVWLGFAWMHPHGLSMCVGHSDACCNAIMLCFPVKIECVKP